MIESTEIKLTRIETTLNDLVRGVNRLTEDVQAIGDRLTRLEEKTTDVPSIRERVAQLERETAVLKLELTRVQQDYTLRCTTSGTRWWDVAKMAISPLLASIITWLLMRRQ